MHRSEYKTLLEINDKIFSRIIIDQHYKIKHRELNDDLIVKLVMCLNGKNILIEKEKEEFQYFSYEPVFYQERPYRLVMVTSKKDDFLGVVNAFRIRRIK